MNTNTNTLTVYTAGDKWGVDILYYCPRPGSMNAIYVYCFY